MTPTLRMQRRARRRLLVAGLLALLLVPAGPSATVRGAGDPPTAASDAYTTNEDTTLVVDAPGVLANDTDPETDALTAVVASDVSHGTLSLAADGSFTYTPAPQFNGSDTFTYHANDGTSDSSDVTVTITVGAVNDAPSFAKGADQVVPEDAGSRSVPGWASALSAGPPDEAGQALSFSVTNDANGLFAGQPAIDPTGSLTYEPAPNANGSATVTAVLHDDGGTASGGVDASPGQTFTITVTAVNDAPVLDPAAFDPPLTSVAEDATDPGGDHVSTMLGGAPPGYIQDVDAGALQGIALTAVDDTHGTWGYRTNNGSSWSAIGAVSAGSALLLAANGTNSVRFVPAPNFNGTASITFVAWDRTSGTAGSRVDVSARGGTTAFSVDSDTASVTVAGSPDPPVAVDDAHDVAQDHALTVAAPGVLANDSDPDGDPITAVKASDPGHGSLTLNADGAYSYTPDAGYTGPDSFTYHASDGTLTSNAATVTLTVLVDTAPVAADDDVGSTAEDTPLVVAAPGVLANDSDADGDPLVAALVAGPAHGQVSLAAGGSFTYTPNANYAGPDSFTYVASDGLIDSAPATVSLSVTPVNDAPAPVADAYATAEDTTLTVPAGNGVLANDVDVDGDTLTAARASDPAHGSVSLAADGSFVYTPAANYHGTDSFSYTASDGVLDSAPVTVTITISPVNDPFTAYNDIATVVSGSPATVINVLANDRAFDLADPGETLTVVAVTQGRHGTVARTSGGGAVTYRPAAGFVGADSFRYTASDGAHTSTATVTVSVPADRFAPIATAPVQSLPTQTLAATTALVRLAWSATDAGTGVARYQLQVSRNGGSYVSIALSSSLARTTTRPLAIGSTFRFRVRAIDRAGNVGSWTYGPAFKVLRYQEDAAGLSGPWSYLSSSLYSGGHERRTGSPGAEATFTFSGRNVGWVTTRGPTRGSVRVFLDGSLVGTVSLARSTAAYRYLILSRGFPASGAHTLRLVFVGPAGRLADVDAFVVLR